MQNLQSDKELTDKTLKELQDNANKKLEDVESQIVNLLQISMDLNSEDDFIAYCEALEKFYRDISDLFKFYNNLVDLGVVIDEIDKANIAILLEDISFLNVKFKEQVANYPNPKDQRLPKRITEIEEQFNSLSKPEALKAQVKMSETAQSPEYVYNKLLIDKFEAEAVEQNFSDIHAIPSNNEIGKKYRSKFFAQILRLCLKQKEPIDEETKECELDDNYNSSSKENKINSELQEVTCVNDDTVAVARAINDEGIHAAILNLANENVSGGGAVNGSRAQEEYLMYFTNLYLRLVKFGKWSSKYFKRVYLSKLLKGNGAYFTKDVKVLTDKDFKLLEEGSKFNIDVITLAGYDLGPGNGILHKALKLIRGLNSPFNAEQLSDALQDTQNIAKLEQGLTAQELLLFNAYVKDIQDHHAKKPLSKEQPEFNMLKEEFIRLTRQKIKLIFQIAHAEKNEGLVLGALSCGAFRFIPPGLSKEERQEWESNNRRWTADCVKQAYQEEFKYAVENGLLEHVKSIKFAVKSVGPDINNQVFTELAQELSGILSKPKQENATKEVLTPQLSPQLPPPQLSPQLFQKPLEKVSETLETISQGFTDSNKIKIQIFLGSKGIALDSKKGKLLATIIEKYCANLDEKSWPVDLYYCLDQKNPNKNVLKLKFQDVNSVNSDLMKEWRKNVQQLAVRTGTIFVRTSENSLEFSEGIHDGFMKALLVDSNSSKIVGFNSSKVGKQLLADIKKDEEKKIDAWLKEQEIDPNSYKGKLLKAIAIEKQMFPIGINVVDDIDPGVGIKNVLTIKFQTIEEAKKFASFLGIKSKATVLEDTKEVILGDERGPEFVRRLGLIPSEQEDWKNNARSFINEIRKEVMLSENPIMKNENLKDLFNIIMDVNLDVRGFTQSLGQSMQVVPDPNSPNVNLLKIKFNDSDEQKKFLSLFRNQPVPTKQENEVFLSPQHIAELMIMFKPAYAKDKSNAEGKAKTLIQDILVQQKFIEHNHQLLDEPSDMLCKGTKWKLQNVVGRGNNCFYNAVIHQMQLMQKANKANSEIQKFLSNCKVGEDLVSTLKSQVPKEKQEFVGEKEIEDFVQKFNVIVGIAHAATEGNPGYIQYFYKDQNNQVKELVDMSGIIEDSFTNQLPQNMPIVKLAYMVNPKDCNQGHYMSILQEPSNVWSKLGKESTVSSVQEQKDNGKKLSNSSRIKSK